LTAAVKRHAGESAVIQRCQVHKRRNVLDHLTDEQKPAIAKRLNAAYAVEEYGAAKEALNTLHRELMDLNPSAARSLGEGMEETLTIHRLHLPAQLRKTMASTNVIESAFSIVEKVCKNVKRWHGGDQRERWVGSGLLVAENQFRRITSYKLIPVLMEEWKALSPSKAAVVKRRKASYSGVTRESLLSTELPAFPFCILHRLVVPRRGRDFPLPRKSSRNSPLVLGTPNSTSASQSPKPAPRGNSTRIWTLRRDNRAHCHGVVDLSESPLHLDLSWRPDSHSDAIHVGVFHLDLHGLLSGGY
jgi:hypothetical protein